MMIDPRRSLADAVRLQLCQWCDEAAAVLFHGPHCSWHAYRIFGRTPAELAKIQMSRQPEVGGTVALPLNRAAPGAASGGLDPLSSSDAAPILSEAELLDVLERDAGWVTT